MLGLSSPGRQSIGLSASKDFQSPRSVFLNEIIFNTVEPLGLMVLTEFYKYISNWWVLPQLIQTGQSLALTIFITFFVPESPKLQYANKEYDESRESLKRVAWFNLQSEEEIEKNFNFKFDTEYVEEGGSDAAQDWLDEYYTTWRWVKHLFVLTI